MKTAQQLLLVIVMIIISVDIVGAQTDSASVTLTGHVSAVIQMRSSVNAKIAGSMDGYVTKNNSVQTAADTQTKLLDVTEINLGEVGPINSSPFVTATVSLNLRSNTKYIVTMSASDFADAQHPDKIQPADIGFGLDIAAHNGSGQVALFAPGVQGDPKYDEDYVAGGRWDYAPNKRLSDYTAGAKPILTGRNSKDGLVVNAIFAVKPQFFEPSTFSTVVTFTVMATP